MRIGILGAGQVGSGLAQLLQRAGHDVRTSTRATVAETAAFGEVVILAVPPEAIREVLKVAGPLTGKVLIDLTNDEQVEVGALEIGRRAGGARVVKTLNTAFASLYEAISASSDPPPMVLCGEDGDAKRIVAALLRDLGFEPLDVGGLEAAPDIEGFGRLLIRMADLGEPVIYRFESP